MATGQERGAGALAAAGCGPHDRYRGIAGYDSSQSAAASPGAWASALATATRRVPPAPD